MNDFRVVPYLPLDGIHPLRDSQVLAFWDCMVRDATAARVFFDGSVTEGVQFLAKAKRTDSLFFFCFDGMTPMGVCWLDTFAPGRAHVHFCMFRECWGNAAKALGRLVLKTIGDMRGAEGGPIFRTLIGITESSNALAIRYAKSLGLSKCGYLPGYLWNSRLQSNVDATVLAHSFGG